MTMLSSLKALFSSGVSRLPVEGAGVASLPLAGAMDFAQLFSGSVADAKQGEAAANPDALPLAEAIESLPPAEAVPAEAAKAQPGASAVWRGADSPLPPGLALGLVKHAAAMQAAPPNGRSGAMPRVAAPSVEAVDAPVPMTEAVDVEAPAPETATIPPEKRVAAAPKDAPVHRKAESLDLPAQVDTAAVEEKPSPATKDEQKDSDAEAVAAAPATVLPIPIIVPTAASAPISVPVEESASKAQAKRPEIIPPTAAPVDQAMPVVETLPAAVEPERASEEAAPILRQADANGTQALDVRQPVARERPSKLSTEQALRVAVTDPLPATSEPLLIAEGAPVAPVVDGKPVKAEALALLQLVRDQVTARQSGAPARLGEQVSAAAKVQAERAAPIADKPEASIAMSPEAVPQTAPATSSQIAPSQATAPAAPTVDLSASLGAQVVDMGVSGQWIDGLARDIAGLSANGAHGRFQLHTDQLGAVQVDIRQGGEGAAVSLTVANEAAEMALRRDSDRLKLDAGLSSVRIAEVKIERAPIAEAARADSAGQQSSQQQSQQGSSQAPSAWANNSQNMGQPQGQQGRWRPGENNGFTPKSSDDPAVLNHEQAQQRGGNTVRARYA